jgi:hypothetical protein
MKRAMMGYKFRQTVTNEFGRFGSSQTFGFVGFERTEKKEFK